MTLIAPFFFFKSLNSVLQIFSAHWPTVVELFKTPCLNIKYPWSVMVHCVLLEVLPVARPQLPATCQLAH